MAHPISHQSSTNAQKRQSLNLSTGPRPLQLVDSVRTSSPGPNSGSSSSPSARGQSLYSPAFVSPGSSSQGTTPITPAFSQKQARRQSSISYNPPPRESSLNSPTLSDSRHRPTLSHTTSLSRRTSYRNSQQLDGVVIAEEVLEQARPALTLVEKNADLLHFIAQKEAKCLELRSQLATHESELLELKRKWERIVSRGMQREGSTIMANNDNAGAGMGLEGLREGVQQGVSLLLSYAAQTSAPSPTSAPATNRTLSHAPNGSTSSASTFTSNSSTRLSQSSASSLEELTEKGDIAAASSGVSRRYSRHGQDVLMVNDTGASPLISPNPDFVSNGEQVTRRRSRDMPSSERAETRSKRMSLPPPPPQLSHSPPTTPDADGSSWMGSVVGKRWEERLTKNQRRASTLFSDVGSSIVQALAPPPIPTPSNKHLAPPATLATVSLLDDDEGGSLLTTPTLAPLAPSPTISNFSNSTMQGNSPAKSVTSFDEEDDWNW